MTMIISMKNSDQRSELLPKKKAIEALPLFKYCLANKPRKLFASANTTLLLHYTPASTPSSKTVYGRNLHPF
jgi:hypothetical protein